MKKNSNLLSDYPKTCETEIDDYDKINIVQSSNCGKKIKKDAANYFKNKNILNCDKNNSSRACPIMFCNINYDNEMNQNIYKRNRIFNRSVLLNPRPDFKTNCYTYITDDNGFKNADSKNNQYFKNIDIENELKNIKEKDSKCSRKNYKPLQLPEQKLKANIQLQQIHKDNYPLSNIDSENNRYPINKCMKLLDRDYCPDNSKCYNPSLPIIDYQENEINDRYKHTNKNILQIGPVRCDKLPCELPWNNVTKRHYKISKKYAYPKKIDTPLYTSKNSDFCV